MVKTSCVPAVLRATNAAAQYAAGQFEAAAEGFKGVLDPSEEAELGLEEPSLPNDRDCRAWACYAARSYAAVQDWDQLQSWLSNAQVCSSRLLACTDFKKEATNLVDHQSLRPS